MGLLDSANRLIAANFASGTLKTTIAAGATSLVLDTGQGAAFPDGTPPFQLVLDDTEIVLCTSRSTDTFTVTRAQESTSAVQHLAGITVELNWTAKYYNDLTDYLARIERILCNLVGGGDGRGRTATLTSFEITAQGTPDMTVDMAAGWGYISGEIVEEEAAVTSDTLVAPSANPRIDLVEYLLGTGLNIKTGVEDASPAAPSLSSDAVKLATIYHYVGETSIKDTDDASNGYITQFNGNWK